MAQQVNVAKVYKTVVEDVISNVREAFLDEGVDEQVLQELKQLWESKLTLSKAIDTIPNEQEQLLAQYTQHQAALPQTAVKQQHQSTQPATHTNVPTVVPQAATTGQPIVAPTGIPVLAAGQGAATIDLSNPAQAATLALYQQQLAALQPGTITLQTGQGGAQFVIQAPQQIIQQAGTTYTVAPQVATTLAPVATSQPQAQAGQPTVHGVIQLDGTHDSSSDDEDDYEEDNDEDNEDEENEGETDFQGEEEDPLNSEDDVSEDDPSEVFDTENVVVCQYDKINRAKNRWKFHLKDGIMNLKGKDYVFQKANGEAEW